MIVTIVVSSPELDIIRGKAIEGLQPSFIRELLAGTKVDFISIQTDLDYKGVKASVTIKSA